MPEIYEAIPLKAVNHLEGRMKWIEYHHKLDANAAFPTAEDARAEVVEHVRQRLTEANIAELMEKKARFDRLAMDLGLQGVDLKDNLADMRENRIKAFEAGGAEDIFSLDTRIIQTEKLLAVADANVQKAKGMAEAVGGEIEQYLISLLPVIVQETYALTATEEKVVDDLRKFFQKHDSTLLTITKKMATSWRYSPSRQGSWFESLRSLATAAAAKAVEQPAELSMVPE